jgi:predicted TIM-barrel fold metal-dependent hydrolase
MKIPGAFLFSLFFFVHPAIHPAAAARIPIIDAHSQVDHKVDLETIIGLMDKGGVSRVILSPRSKLRRKAFMAFASRHPGRITPAVRTKSGNYRRNRPKYYRRLKKQLTMPQFGAMAEVILWHAQKGKKAPEVIIRIAEPQVQAPLRAALERNWPFIAHIEFAAAGPDRDKFMADIEGLMRRYLKHPFPLIHMGQLEVEEVGRLIRAHPNVYFMTSHSNPVTVNSSTQPWVNLFEGGRIAPDWKKLILRHPDRFILAFDNVWADHWEDYYLEQIGLWQKALAGLPPKAAHALAHGNAERLWRLPPAK